MTGRQRLGLRALFVAVGCGLALAACGSQKPNNHTSSSAGGPSFKTAVSDAYRFAACMRQHGVANFPDPIVHQSAHSQSIGIRAVITKSPADRSAQKACAGIMPQPTGQDLASQAAQQRQHAQDMLSFARCIRSRGIYKFPDPDSQGNLSPQTLSSAGVDLHAPAVLNAARACVPASHGAVSAAAINAVANGAAPGSSASAQGTTT